MKYHILSILSDDKLQIVLPQKSTSLVPTVSMENMDITTAYYLATDLSVPNPVRGEPVAQALSQVRLV